MSYYSCLGCSKDLSQWPRAVTSTILSYIAKARIRAAQQEGQEAEEYAKELGVHDKLFGGGEKKSKGAGKGKKGGGNSEDALAALIRRRQEDRGASFLDNLAEKYGANKTKKGSRKRGSDDDDGDAEPSEEAFQAAAARLGSKKAAKNGTAGKSSTHSSKRAKR